MIDEKTKELALRLAKTYISQGQGDGKTEEEIANELLEDWEIWDDFIKCMDE